MLPGKDLLSKENVWQRAIELTDRVLNLSVGLDFPIGTHWLAFVVVCLDLSNEKSNSIRMLLERGYSDSALVLSRSFFELLVNLAYLSKDPEKRLSQYLRHGGIPITDEEAQQLQQKLTQVNLQEVVDSIPKRSWKNLKQMCRDLGSDWLGEYETCYRYTSVPNHYGSFTLGTNFKRLVGRNSPSGYEKAVILVGALEFHLRVAEIAVQIFPEQIASKTVSELKGDLQHLERFIVQCIKKEVGQQ